MDAVIESLRANLLREDPPTGALDIDDAAYFASGLGGSGLKPALQSGQHWLAAQIKRALADDKDDAGRRFGHAVHCLVLEPDEWGKRYAPPFRVGKVDASLTLYESGKEVADRLRALKDDGHKVKVSGSNADKLVELQAVEPGARYTSDLAADYYREQGGRTILLEDEEARARAAAAAVWEWHSRWIEAGNRPILDGPTERAIAWVDESTGVYCRAKIDAVAPDEHAWVDLKTVGRADDGFMAQVRSHEYGLQAAHYLDGYRTLTGQDRTPRWGWLCVEDQPPHGVCLHWADPEYMDRAYRRRRLCLDRIYEVLTRPDADVYPVEAMTVTLAAWERREEEE